MAFGEFMKKLTNKIKSFGNKVKEVAKKIVPTVLQGADWLKNQAVPAARRLAEIVPGRAGDAIRQATDAVDRTTDNVIHYTGSIKNNLLTPDVT